MGGGRGLDWYKSCSNCWKTTTTMLLEATRADVDVREEVGRQRRRDYANSQAYPVARLGQRCSKPFPMNRPMRTKMMDKSKKWHSVLQYSNRAASPSLAAATKTICGRHHRNSSTS